MSLALLKPEDPRACDLLGVLAGVKPMLHASVREEEAPRWDALCRRLSLRQARPLMRPDRRTAFQDGARIVFVSRRESVLKEGLRAWALPRIPDSNRALGRLLGYPECCVRAYLRWAPRPGRKDRDLVRAIAARTPRAAEPLPFLLNDLFTFASTPLRAQKGEDRLYARLARENQGEGTLERGVVSWHPCSYRCAPSLRSARAVFALMARFFPADARALRALLARPVLYLDRFAFAALEGARVVRGERGAREVRFSAVGAPRAPLPAALRRRLAGGVLRLEGRVAAGAPLLLDFSGGTDA